MKTAVGIIGIGLSLIALLQSCMVGGAGSLGNDDALSQAGALGVLTAIFMFFGGAFAFGLPRVAGLMFIISAFASRGASEAFPDIQVWGTVSAVLGIMILFAAWRAKKSLSGEK